MTTVPGNKQRPRRSVRRRQEIRRLAPLAVIVLAMMMAFAGELTALGMPVDKAITCMGAVATITIWLVRRILTLDKSESATDEQDPVRLEREGSDDGPA